MGSIASASFSRIEVCCSKRLNGSLQNQTSEPLRQPSQLLGELVELGKVGSVHVGLLNVIIYPDESLLDLKRGNLIINYLINKVEGYFGANRWIRIILYHF